jgi:2-phosphosulfolactate phosphatase
MHWHCHDIFHRMPPGATAGGIAVVIDVLRASTTMITALANGAVAILPRRSIEEARAAAANLPGAILGGERAGVRIAGFDLGNSPTDYTTDRLAGRPVVMTTTNGTSAIAACHDAAEVLVGAIVNRITVAAAARRLAVARGCDAIHIVCAGTDGEVTSEDVLAAGGILAAASHDPAARDDVLDASAHAALTTFGDLAVGDRQGLEDRIIAAFRTSLGGRNLINVGMDADLATCAAIDSLAVVPRLDPQGKRLLPLLAD